MGTYGPQFLLYPVVPAIKLAGIKVEGSSAPDNGAGIYYGRAPRAENLTDSSLHNGVLCEGFSEVSIFPYCGAENSSRIFVYGVWGNKTGASEQSQWTVQLICTITSRVSGGCPSHYLPNGSQIYATGTVTLAAKFSTVLDSVSGLVTKEQQGNNTIIGTVTIPYLGDANYLIIAGEQFDPDPLNDPVEPNANHGTNVYLRFA